MFSRTSEVQSGRLALDLTWQVPPHQHPATCTTIHSSTPESSGRGKTAGRDSPGTPPTSSALPDLSRGPGGPVVPSTASSSGGLFLFSSPRFGNQILLEISDSEGYSSGSEVSHISSEEVETAMTADDVPDAMVDSALSLDALSQFLYENHDAIDLSTTDIAMYIGAIMRAMNVITTTGLAAECVSWDTTGEVREALAHSCKSLLSSICPEGASSSAPSPDESLGVRAVPTDAPAGTSSTSAGGERGIPPAPRVLSGASQPLTPIQARRARRKKLVEDRVRSQLPLGD